jgi:hypothetical protein
MEDDLKKMAAFFPATGLGNGRRPQEDGSILPSHWFGEWKKTSRRWQRPFQQLVWGMEEDLKKMTAFFPAKK